MGVGIVPIFLASSRSDLVPLTGALEDAETELWLLTHRSPRHRSVWRRPLRTWPRNCALTWVMADQSKGGEGTVLSLAEAAPRSGNPLARMMFACPTGWSAIEACRT